MTLPLCIRGFGNGWILQHEVSATSTFPSQLCYLAALHKAIARSCYILHNSFLQYRARPVRNTFIFANQYHTSDLIFEMSHDGWFRPTNVRNDDGPSIVHDADDSLSKNLENDTLGARLGASVSHRYSEGIHDRDQSTTDHGSLLDLDVDDNMDLMAALHTMHIRLRNAEAENKRLRELYHVEDESGRWPILYRVQCIYGGAPATYSDPPIYITYGGHMHIEGKRRVPNEQRWEQSQDDASFVVYKLYVCRRPDPGENIEDFNEHDRHPKKISEHVHILKENTQNSIRHIITSDPGLSIYPQSDIIKDNRLHSPYVFFHHFENELRKSLSYLGAQDTSLRLLVEYVKEESEASRSNARAQIHLGVMQDWLVPWLYKPGELLVSLTGDEAHVVTLMSVLTMTSSSNARKTYSCKVGRIKFDGQFRMLQETAILQIPIDASVQITELSLYPLRCCNPDLRNSLLERGRKFYNCHKGRYVSYAADRSALKGDFVRFKNK